MVSRMIVERILCRMRAKEAYNRSKLHERSETFLDCRVENLNKEKEQLYSMMPSRRRWNKLTHGERTIDNLPIDTIERNYRTIRKTINIDRRRHPKENYLKVLDSYCQAIVNQVNEGKIELSKPRIIPIIKSETEAKVVFRPLAIYSFEENVILKIVARYMIKKIDNLFSESSYAFRARRAMNGTPRVPTHHDIVGEILAYREKNSGKQIYVYECDIQKFYDTINHAVVRNAYKRLKQKMKRETGDSINPVVDIVLDQYLRSYNYYQNIETESSGHNYWDKVMHSKSHKNCQYSVVSDTMISNGVYKTKYRARYGVPQGGALSGIIANIVLNTVDEKVEKIDPNESLYIRYCDDTIIMSTKRSISVRMKGEFERSISKNKLVTHAAYKVDSGNNKKFWNAKSKEIYIWGGNQGSAHWIGMVGYEISSSGEVRIRRKSIRKEVKKQYEIVRRAITAIQKGKNRYSSRSLIETTHNKLIAMAVGRVRIHNYKTNPNSFCWINGFRKVNDNKYMRKQARYLDKKRNSYLKEMYTRKEKSSVTGKSKEKRKVEYRTHYGKPYSYYYHIVYK